MEKGERRRSVSDLALILALLYSSDRVIEGRTRFQKMVYLLKNSFDVPFGFEYRMYFYGPYSDSLADALQLLKAIEFVQEKKTKIARYVVQYNYEITDAGRDFLESYFSQTERNQQIYKNIRLGVQKMRNLPTSYLVSLSKRHYAGIEKAFYFFLSERSDAFTGEFAMSLEEFGEKIKRIRIEALAFHFYRGDFERWFSEVFNADKLAEQIENIRKANPPRDKLRDLLCDIILVKRA